MDYKKGYSVLFNAMTQAVIELEGAFMVTPELSRGVDILKAAQRETEEMFMRNGTTKTEEI